jgi:hypothetical protein
VDGMTSTSIARHSQPLTDEELAAMALAADPDVKVGDDAVSLWERTESQEEGLLPAWYMPSPMARARLLYGWRRRVVQLLIASFLVINAYGLCSTYGWVGFG